MNCYELGGEDTQVPTAAKTQPCITTLRQRRSTAKRDGNKRLDWYYRLIDKPGE